MFRTYRVLGRKYKKHLKSLIVVHPSPMARLVLGVLRVAVSPKFVRQKVTQLRSLEELAAVMPLEQLRVPDAVLAHDRSIQESGKTAVHGATTSQSPVQVPARAFGVPLVDLMGANGERGVPRFVCECVEYVRMNGRMRPGPDGE